MQDNLICVCVVLAFFGVGCASKKNLSLDLADYPGRISNRNVGSWKNIHKGDPELAGVSVQQFPDNPYEAPQWEGKHPASILFVFWDGRVNQLGYSPDGAVVENFWWSSKKPGQLSWTDLDYTEGSRPAFQSK